MLECRFYESMHREITVMGAIHDWEINMFDHVKLPIVPKA